MMIKTTFKKLLCILLAVVMFTGLVPLEALGLTPEETPRNSNMLLPDEHLETSLAMDATLEKLPPTFIEGILSEEEYIYIPRAERVPSENVPEGEVSISPIPDMSKVPEMSKQEKEDFSRFKALLDSAEYFSDLSVKDQTFLCSYARAGSAAFAILEGEGLALKDSVLYAQLATQYGFSPKALLENCPTAEDCMGLSKEMAIYTTYLKEKLKGSDLDKNLKGFILEGYSFAEVRDAYVAGRALDIEMEFFLEKGGSSAKQDGFTATEKKNFEAIADDFGLKMEKLTEYAKEEGKSFSEIEEALIGSGVFEEEISSMPSAASSSGDEEGTVYPEKNLGAPYSYEYNNNERINLNSGSLVHETVDYTLPGVNGLDLSIGRRYDSDAANIGNPVGYSGAIPIYTYYVVWGATAYYDVPGLGVGSWPYYDVGPYNFGPYSNYNDALAYCNQQVTGILTWPNHDGNGTTLIRNYYAYVTSSITGYSYYSYSSTESNSYLNNLYGLGQGWSFMFSSIETSGANKYLHLSDGRAYEINITSTAGDSNLKDYSLSDMRVEQEANTYSNGSVSSAYTLYHKDGRREFFSSDGKLIGIRDKYDNTIKFVNDTLNGYPRITITDTLNRTIVISGQSTANNGHVVTVALPDSVTLKYTVERNTSGASCDALAKYEDAMNVATNYSYTMQNGGFNMYGKNTSGATNYFLNLTTITHPTSAQTVYEYETVSRNLGSSGLAVNYRIASRTDKIGDAIYNEQAYEYSANNNTGYPAQTNPASLPDTFTYHTTVTDSDGISAKFTFSNEHLRISCETSEGSLKISDELYEYNADKLPTRTTQKLYNSSDQDVFIQTVSMTEYDNRGNVTAKWSPLAGGDTNNTEHKTTYTYDLTYSMPLSISYKQDAGTTVAVEYTLDATKKHVLTEKVLENNIEKNRSAYTYSGTGNIITERHYKDGFTSFNQVDYSYSNNAYVSQIKYAGILDADGNPANSSPGADSGTITSSYQYDSLGRMTQSTNANGNVTAYAYNKNGDVLLTTYPDSTTTQYVYNYTTNHITVTEPGGAQFKYTYTPLGQEYEVIDVQSGAVLSRKEYDNKLRLVKSSEFTYGAVMEYTYDSHSRLISRQAKDGTTVISHESYEYASAIENGTLNKVTKTIHGDANAPSIVTSSYSDIMGNIVKSGSLVGGTEYLDTFTYDYAGNLLTKLTAYAAQRELDYSAKWEYDYAGRAIKTYNADGGSSTASYDALGNLIAATDFAGTETTYTYDALGRLLKKNVPIETGTYGVSKSYYDPVGNVISAVTSNQQLGGDSSWARQEYVYDSTNQLVNTVQYNGEAIDNVTCYTYDASGNTLTMTTGLSSLSAEDGKTTSYTYDRYGNVLTVTDALGQSATNIYSTTGKPLGKTDRNGNVTQFTHDALGRLTQSTVTTPEGETQTLSYTYTATGATRSQSDGSFAITNSYDALGRVTQVAETGGVVKSYGYDFAGNRTSFTLAKENTDVISTTYTYDNQSRLGTVSEGGALRASYTYDANGNRASLTYSNGNVSTYTYNLANWVTGVVNKNGGAPVSSYSYTYYADGNQRTKTDHTGRSTTYAYDGTGRLTGESESGDDGMNASYSYDSYGNRTAMTVTGEESYSVSYAYDANNRLLSEEKTAEGITNRTNYHYDPNGNLLAALGESLSDSVDGAEELALSLNGMQVYEYNALGQQVKTIVDGLEVSYTYRPDGLRHSKETAEGNVTHLWNGSNIAADIDSGDGITKYIRGIGLLCFETGVMDTQFYLYNGHGDVVQLTGGDGALRQSYDYDAFGNQRGADEGDPNPFRYCGEYFDVETGTIYLRARYYNPRTGRFLAEDPIHDGLNWYAYANGNPIRFKDPSGLKAGDLFTSADAAAIDFYEYYYGITDYTQYEMGSAIYMVGTSYSYTDPRMANPHSVAIQNSFSDLPPGSIIVAYAHSHPGSESDVHTRSSDRFSDGDIRFAAEASLPLYVITPNNAVRLITVGSANEYVDLYPNGDPGNVDQKYGQLIASDLDFRTINGVERHNLMLQYGLALEQHLTDCTYTWHSPPYSETSPAYRDYINYVSVKKKPQSIWGPRSGVNVNAGVYGPHGQGLVRM